MNKYPLWQKVIGASQKAGKIGLNLGELLLKHPSILNTPTQYLFLLSHMRSRSTVLAHILGSNPEIAGYRELHHSYRRPLDFIKLKADLFQDFGYTLKDRVLMDKILHNNYNISTSVLRSQNVRYIILIREPSRTIKSIMKMGIANGTPGYDNPYMVADYYCKRLTQLTEYARILNGKFFLLNSDTLVESPQDVLDPLKNWLNLTVPLNSTYRSFDKTGQIGAGDPSRYIKSGKIIATPEDEEIHIPQDIVKNTKKVFTDCVDKITLNYNNTSFS